MCFISKTIQKGITILYRHSILFGPTLIAAVASVHNMQIPDAANLIYLKLCTAIKNSSHFLICVDGDILNQVHLPRHMKVSFLPIHDAKTCYFCSQTQQRALKVNKSIGFFSLLAPRNTVLECTRWLFAVVQSKLKIWFNSDIRCFCETFGRDFPV